MPAAIRIEDLHKRYGEVVALQGVSLQVQPGEIFGLLGPNGAGKTSTIRCLCTLSQPDGGTIEVCGRSVQHEPKGVRRQLGYVAQEVALDKVLTGRELLQLQAALYHLPRQVARERIEQLLALLGLSEYAHRRTGTYSGGLRKRLDLAAGLLHQPAVLVLDEPTAGLDVESRWVVWDLLRQLRAAGTTVLMASHDLEEIDALADRVAIIDRGRTLDAGTTAELKARLGGDRVTLRLREFTPEREAQQARALLESLPCVETAIVNTAQGNSLNLVVARDGDVLPAIERSLQEAGLPTFSIAQSQPSLDDVYLVATGRTLADADLAATGNGR
ncbi:MAG: lysozyme [Cyanobacteria bacterium QS_8_64_29]|nr:MAG: lysozyme [Cyanobacteria bacterium QS_8_64_29]